MKRPLILIAGLALAFALVVPGAGGVAPSAHAHTTTPPTACTDTTLGGAPTAAAYSGLAADCNRLYALRYALTTPEALNWNLNLPIASWTGVTLSGSPLRVTGLRLTPYTFTAALAELTHLPKLVDLDLVTFTTPVTLPTRTTPITPPTTVTDETDLPDNPPTCTLTTLGGTRAANSALAGDCDTLLSIKSTLEGSSLPTEKLDWSATKSLTDWKGIIVSGTPKRVTILELPKHSLKGIIPTQLGNLTGLTTLDLSGNELGSGPPTAGQTRDLPADIPTQLGNLTGLTTLDLSHNRLWGHIPTQLGNLKELTTLNLNGGALGDGGNALTGKIPTQLGSLKKLQVLNLRYNQLGGDFTADAGYGIPTQLGDLPELRELLLGPNGRLSGPIPTQLGNLAKLRELKLNVNRLSGPLPTQLGNLANLERLQLSHNQLSGSIPTQVGTLPNLMNILLRHNRFSGGIPPFPNPNGSLASVQFKNNSFTGCVPSSLPAAASNDIAALSLPATCVVLTTAEKTED